MTEDEAGTPEVRAMLVDLFTEIAVLEHLLRFRFEPAIDDDLSAADFGVINYFCRLKKSEERVASLAWSFQVDVAAMRATVAGLAARGLVTIDDADNPCVRITDAGRETHIRQIDTMAPDILAVMAEISLDDARVTTATLKEIRRTFDNLPDR